jgi:transposase-like protein
MMAKKGTRIEKIIEVIRAVEVMASQGSTVAEACRKTNVAEQTYYRWRKEYGGLRLNQAKRLKELERENGRLKKLVADLSLDNAILREAHSGNF